MRQYEVSTVLSLLQPRQVSLGIFPVVKGHSLVASSFMPQPEPTMIGCPACAGVVGTDVQVSPHVEFRCSVGHTFSLEELYVAKEEQVEHAQWSLIALLKHLQMILRIDAEGNQKLSRFHPQDLRQRLEQISRHITSVERLIQETRLPSTREAMDGNEPAFQERYE